MQSTESNGEKPGSIYVPDKARSLTARADGSPCIDRGPQIIAAVYDMTHADEVMQRVEGGKCQTLNSRMGTGGNQVPVIAYALQRSDEYKESQVSHTLSARDYKSATDLVCTKTVRRLTPLECERLQGLPDFFTLIDDKSCSDTARYKALGNGMCQMCADYVIKRIVEVCDGH